MKTQKFEVMVRPVYHLTVEAESKKQAENDAVERLSALLETEDMPICPRIIMAKAVKSKFESQV